MRARTRAGVDATRSTEQGQSMSALPGILELDLLRKGEGIVHLDPEIAVLSTFVCPSKSCTARRLPVRR